MKFIPMIIKNSQYRKYSFANLNLSGENNSLYYFDKKGSECYDQKEKVLKKL